MGNLYATEILRAFVSTRLLRVRETAANRYYEAMAYGYPGARVCVLLPTRDGHTGLREGYVGTVTVLCSATGQVRVSTEENGTTILRDAPIHTLVILD